MHSCRARRACHPDEPISKCLLRKRRVLYTEPRLSSFDAGPEPVLHLIGGQPTFQPSRASGPSPAHPRLRHVRAAARFEQNRAAFAHALRAAACEIASASFRESVCQSVSLSVFAFSLTTNSPFSFISLFSIFL